LPDGRRHRERAVGTASLQAVRARRRRRDADRPGPGRRADERVPDAGRRAGVSVDDRRADASVAGRRTDESASDVLRLLSLNQATIRSWSAREAIEGCARHGVEYVGLWRDKVAETGLAATRRLLDE